jgi:hypothetical protein
MLAKKGAGSSLSRRILLRALLVFAFGGVVAHTAFAQTDPLPSWNDGVGIPPEQVVGSSGVVKFQIGADRKPLLMKEGKVEFIEDGPGKPVGINRFIGRRPILAFGNSDGDLQMLQYTMAGSGPRLALYVHHDDAEREYAPMIAIRASENWTRVSMKRGQKAGQ